MPGVILAVPCLVWIARRLLAWIFPRHPVWGVERPALETWASILAFAPLVGWLGNPAWWRETMPRLAHYYLLNTDRRGSLPDIRIFYLGQTYVYSLPWHNAWVLIAVTVPATLLAAALVGVVYALANARRDRLPLYFLVQLVTLPILRMLPTPAHDGVRLFLPTFFFLAALAGWGTVWLADLLARVEPRPGERTAGGPGPGRARPGRLAAHQGPPVRAVVLQRADRRPARGLAPRLRADVLVRRLQRPDARRAERPEDGAAAGSRGRDVQRADQHPDLRGAPIARRVAWRPGSRRPPIRKRYPISGS